MAVLLRRSHYVAKHVALAAASQSQERLVARLKASLDELEDSGFQPDSTTYASVVRDCKNAKALAEGQRVHSHISKHGYDRSLFLGNLLVQMYGHCGSVGDARLVFDKLVEPNSFSWNIMISAYAQNGHLQEAKILFDRMPDQDVVSRNAMIAAYARNGHLDDARSLFDGMQERDLVSWNAMISGYAQNDCGQDAIELFRVMDLEGVPPNRITFVSLLDACSSVETMSLLDAKVMHSVIIPTGHLSNVAVATALLNLYGRRGSIEHAKLVFDQMPEPNVVSWTTMMTLYVQQGDLSEARAFFNQMPERNTVSWNAMIAAYAQKGQLQEAKSLFDEMPKRDTVSWNSMITAYAQNGRIQEARSLFDDLKERNLISWNSMITGYTQNGHPNEALKSFKTMQLEGFCLNKITIVSILDACSSTGNLADGKLIDGLISESGHTEVVVKNALINMYAKCGSLEDARNIFDNMPNPDVVSSTAMIAACAKLGSVRDARRIFDRMREQDVVAWTAIVAAYAQNGHIDEAVSMFERMPVRDVVSWNTMIVAYGHNRRLEEAKGLFDRMPRPNVVSWNALIAAYTQNGECKLAFQLFPLMDLEGEHPDKVTFLSVLDACASIAGPAEGKLVHATIVDSGIVSDLELGTTLVNTYGRCGSLENARSLFNRMPQHSSVSWNSMVGAYAQNGHGDEAVELSRAMELHGFISGEITFTNILFACSHAGLLDDGRNYFVSMRGDYGIDPGLEHYLCMLDLLGRAGMMEDARDLINTMPFEPDPIAWKTILGASRIHCDVKQGANAAENFLQMSMEDSAPFVLMSNMYTGWLFDGWQYFVSMSGDYGIVAEADHYACMIDLLGRAGELEDMEDLISNMPFEADDVVWTALLGACRIHGDIERGENAAQRVAHLNPEMAVPYVCSQTCIHGATRYQGIYECSDAGEYRMFFGCLL